MSYSYVNIDEILQSIKSFNPPDPYVDNKEEIDKGVHMITRDREEKNRNFVKDFRERLMLTNHYNRCDEEGKPYESDYKTIIDQETNSRTTKPPYILLTVNVKPGITYELLKQVVDKFIKKKCIVAYYGCYEVRKENFDGLHCHILIHYSGRPYNINRSIRSHFKKVCDTTNNSCCNVKYIAEELLQEKVGYINGVKQNKKLPAVGFSDAWKQDRHFGESAFTCRTPSELIIN